MCTVEQVTNRLSAVGTGLRIDHNPGGAMLEAIESASNDVAQYLCSRYPNLVTLSENRWVQSVTTMRCIWYLCTWRLNQVPPWLETEWRKYEDKLLDIQIGKGNVPGLPAGTSRDRTPILIHMTNTLLGPRGLAVTGPDGLPIGAYTNGQGLL
jgi:hypothetical protein